MKNLTKIFMAVAVAMFAFSCVADSTEDLGPNIEIENEGAGVTELTISMEEVTKTHLGDKVVNEDGTSLYPLYWSEGDAISVNGQASLALENVVEDSAAATFKFNNKLTAPFCVVYPAEAAVAAEEAVEGEESTPAAPATVYPVNFLAEQPYTVGTFAPQAAPMYGYSENVENIQLNHLTGVLRFAIKGNGEKVTSIDVTAQKGKIAGAFTVDCETGALTASESATGKTTVTFAEPLVLGAEAQAVYVTVPAGNYGTFLITVKTEAHEKMTVKFSSDVKPINAGTVREFAAFEYEANQADTEDADFLIDSEEALVEFAKKAATFFPRTKAQVVADLNMAEVMADPAKAKYFPIQGFGEYEFDGGKNEGYSISGMTKPLFGTTAATIKNVNLKDVNIEVTDLAKSGALVCELYGGSLENCSVAGAININNTTAELTISGGGQYNDFCHGGLAGYVSASTVTNCTNDIDITITSFCSPETSIKATVGGVVGGCANNSSFTHLTNDGDIVYVGTTQKQNIYISGIVGKENSVSGTKAIAALSNCTNNGAIYTTKESVAGNSLLLSGITGAIPENEDLTCDNLVNNGALTHNGTSGNLTIAGLVCYNSHCSYTNCSNTKDLTLAVEATAGTVTMGGLLAATHTVKEISNCTNSGNISIGNNATAGAADLAGIIAGTLKPTTMTKCSNSGAISVGDGIEFTDKVYLSGIAASLSAYDTDTVGTITECTNSGPLYFGNSSNTTGTGNDDRLFVSGLFYAINAGDVSKCYNEATGTISVKSGDWTSRYMIAGLFSYFSFSSASYAIKVTDCENKADITVAPVGDIGSAQIGGVTSEPYKGISGQGSCKDDPKYDVVEVILTRVKNSGNVVVSGNYTTAGYPYLGGLIGTNNYTILKLDGCENSGDVTFSGTAAAPLLGGITGYDSGNKSLEILNCKNSGNVTQSNVVTGTGKESAVGKIRLGGIVGYMSTNIPVTISNTTNTGNITSSGEHTASADDANTYSVGGIIGLNKSGKITISGCTNGYISEAGVIDAEKGIITIGTAPAGVGIGGIVGTSTTAISISGSKNYGYVHQSGKGGNGNTYRPFVGGIIGMAWNALTATDCHNYGTVEYGPVKATGKADVGGICGETGSTAEKTLSGCTNAGTVRISAPLAGESNVGGIIGMGQSGTKIINCKNLEGGVVSYTSTSGSTLNIGGIAGSTNNTNVEILYCRNEGKVEQTDASATGTQYIGGINGYAYAFGLIQYCSNNGPIESAAAGSIRAGGIIGSSKKAAAAMTIKDCYNEYDLTFVGKSTGVYYAGGIIGHVQSASKSGPVTAENLLNIGNITFSGTGKTECIGGIVGFSDVHTVDKSKCYATITAMGKEGKVGFIEGCARADATKATNCQVGGKLVTSLSKAEVDEESGTESGGGEELPGNITTSNWYNHIYATEVTEAVATGDGCSLLGSKPNVPDYTYTPAE